MLYSLPPTEDSQWEKIVPPLTLRQRLIIKCLAEGKSQDEVAKICHISRRTLNLSLEEMRIEHQCHTTTQLCVMVAEQVRRKIIA